MNRYQRVSKNPLQPAQGVLHDGNIRANGIIRRQHEPPASFCSRSFHVRRPGWLQLFLRTSNGLLYSEASMCLSAPVLFRPNVKLELEFVASLETTNVQ